jgi:hypothetical protein
VPEVIVSLNLDVGPFGHRLPGLLPRQPTRGDDAMSMARSIWLGLLALAVPIMTGSPPAAAQQQQKPNILFIMGDDIGWMQPSIYHRGLMVGETPNIDRIGNEGAIFMTYYAEQSCTAGRNAFFTGMQPLRTGMIPPQLPGSPSYLRPGTPALAKFLIDLGYNTGEFGKNHLGDHTDALPTAHGFQEFWGYLYHLDAMQGVSFPDINKSPTQQTVVPPCRNTPIPGIPEVPGAVDPKTTICLTPPRNVLWCKSSNGTSANQTCQDQGPLTLERSKTVDEEISAKVIDFLDRNDPRKANKPFFVCQYPGIVKTMLDGVNQIDYLTGKSEKSAREVFYYYTGQHPSAVRYKNWKFYYTMVPTSNPGDALLGAQTYHWSLVDNIKRDPFEMATGATQGTMFGIGGALAGPVTAYVYDWNLLPIGQQLWLKELETYNEFPPLQSPESYNLSQVLEQVKQNRAVGHASD